MLWVPWLLEVYVVTGLCPVLRGMPSLPHEEPSGAAKAEIN